MNHYPHHIGDFNTATRHLTRLERSIYRDAIEFYYVTEEALDATDFDRLARRLCCQSEEEKQALKYVLDEFFDLDIDAERYVQPRCERELQEYREKVAANGAVKDSVNRRQQVHRQQRAAMFEALRKVGVHLLWNAPIAEVRAAFNEHCKGVDLSRTCHAPVTANHSPLTNTHNQNLPPNPPAGGAVTGEAVESAEQSAEQSGEQEGAELATSKGLKLENPAATGSKLMGFFPEHRRTRVIEVARMVTRLVEGGAVTEQQLLTAAAAQSAALCRDDGKACPSVLRWLKESRWLDASQAVPAPVTGGVTGSVTGVTGVAGQWHETRSGIELMGQQLGLGVWDESKDRLFSVYEARVMQAYRNQFGGLNAH